MKFLTIIMMAAAMAFNASTADVLKDVEVGGIAAIRQADFLSGHTEKGAGVSLAFPVTKSKDVKLEGRLLSFEDSPNGDEGDKWEGDVIDEIALSARFKLLATENKVLRLEGSAGGDRSQQRDDFGFHLGGYVVWQPLKNGELRIGREIRTWLDNPHDHLTAFSFGFKF